MGKSYFAPILVLIIYIINDVKFMLGTLKFVCNIGTLKMCIKSNLNIDFSFLWE